MGEHEQASTSSGAQPCTTACVPKVCCINPVYPDLIFWLARKRSYMEVYYCESDWW